MFLLALLSGGKPRSEDAEDTSFDEMYRQHYAKIAAFFRDKNRSSAECEDLAQETFLRAYRRFSGFRGDAKLSTWLYTIATNVWLNRIRDARAAKRDVLEVSIEGDFREAAEDSQSKALDDERRALLHSAIAELPPKMRRCVWHRVHYERSFAEIAVLEGVTESTAKSHFSRAAEQLRPKLAKHYPEQLSDLFQGGDR